MIESSKDAKKFKTMMKCIDYLLKSDLTNKKLFNEFKNECESIKAQLV